MSPDGSATAGSGGSSGVSGVERLGRAERSGRRWVAVRGQGSPRGTRHPLPQGSRLGRRRDTGKGQWSCEDGTMRTVGAGCGRGGGFRGGGAGMGLGCRSPWGPSAADRSHMPSLASQLTLTLASLRLPAAPRCGPRLDPARPPSRPPCCPPRSRRSSIPSTRWEGRGAGAMCVRVRSTGAGGNVTRGAAGNRIEAPCEVLTADVGP